jgi:hypothetical protein
MGWVAGETEGSDHVDTGTFGPACKAQSDCPPVAITTAADNDEDGAPGSVSMPFGDCNG